MDRGIAEVLGGGGKMNMRCWHDTGNLAAASTGPIETKCEAKAIATCGIATHAFDN